MIAEGTLLTALGIAAGLAFGVLLQRITGSYFEHLRSPGALVICGAAAILLAAAALAPAWPAVRASRVDVIQTLRAD